MFWIFPFPGFRNPLFLLIIPFTLTAGIYREKLRQKYNSDVAQFGTLRNVRITATEFDSGLFSCCGGHKGVKKSFFNFFCIPVRLASNASAIGFMDYWSVVIIGSFFLPLIFILGYIQRLHMRGLFAMNPHPVSDFFAWMCCCPCALTQEAKFIDHGFRALRDGISLVVLQNRVPLATDFPETPPV